MLEKNGIEASEAAGRLPMTRLENSIDSGSGGAAPISLRELAAIFFRNIRLVGATFFLAVIATFVYAQLTPRYEAHFRVLLRHGRSDPVVSAQDSSWSELGRHQVSEEEINSEAELLRDDGLLQTVAATSGLLSPTISQSERTIELQRAAQKLGRRLEIEPLRRSNLIEVRYRADDPGKAGQVLSALSSAYIQKHLELQRPSGTTQFFDQQMDAYAKALGRSESRLVQFTRNRGVASAALERDIALQKLGEAEAEYRQIQMSRMQLEQREAALRRQIAAFPARSVTVKRWSDNPQLLQQLKSRLLELELRRTELLTRYQRSYALVRELDTQIEEARQAIAAEALTPVRDESSDKDPNYEWARMELEKAEVEHQALRARESTAQAQIASIRERARELESESISQQDLTREAKAAEEDYLLYRRKREEARISDALDDRRILNIAMVEPPVVPLTPVHSLLFYLLIALGLGVSASTAAAFTADYMDPTIRTPQEVQALVDVPAIAWLPERPVSAAMQLWRRHERKVRAE